MASVKQIERLRALVQLDVDALAAYEVAIKGLHDEQVISKLSGFRVDHARHLQDLNALLSKAGGQPVEMTPDFKGTLLKALTQVTGRLGTEAALLSMVANEELIHRAYQAALKKEWDADARAVLEATLGDEHRHLEWLKHAIRERPWAHEAEVHP